jgi:hypothetical protein
MLNRVRVLLVVLLLTSPVGCASVFADTGPPPLATPLANREMEIVDHLVDPVTGALLFPNLREWHGQVQDYFCGVLVSQDRLDPEDCE